MKFFTLAKTLSKLNMECSYNLKKKIKRLVFVVRVLETMQNLVISWCYFSADGKEMYQQLQHTCTAIVLLIIKPFV